VDKAIVVSSYTPEDKWDYVFSSTRTSPASTLFFNRNVYGILKLVFGETVLRALSLTHERKERIAAECDALLNEKSPERWALKVKDFLERL